MIRFLSQIRQRLLTENRFRKYLLYAIGEILLVVIGILIALQVNTWNEDRQDRVLEKELLSQMTEELKKDKKMLNGAIGMSGYAISSANYISIAIVENMPMNDSLSIAFTGMTIPFVFFQPNNATYNNLNAIGFHFIKNKSLRNEIQELYHAYSWGQKTQSDFNKEYLENMDRVSIEYFDLFANGDTTKMGNQPLDWKALRENRLFKNNLGNYISLHRLALGGYKDLSAEVDTLLIAIELELNKR